MPLPNILGAFTTDIDFPNSASVTMSSTAGYFPAACQGALSVNGGSAPKTYRSYALPGGPVTSCWFMGSYRTNTTSINTGSIYLSKLADTSHTIGLGCGSTSNKAALFVNGSKVAEEAGTSFGTGVLHRYDLQVINCGSNPGTLNLYIDGASSPTVTYTGDLSSLASIDHIYLTYNNGVNYYSAMAILDGDSRTYLIKDGVPDGDGDTNEWDGDGYGGIDDLTINDIDNIYTNTNGEKFQCAISDMPAGNYDILGAVITARACKSADSALSLLKMGLYEDGGAEDMDAGQTQTTGFTTYIRIMSQLNAAAFTTAKVNAMQLEFIANT